MWFFLYWLTPASLSLLFASVVSTGNTLEYQLKAKLFTNYSKHVPPQPINTPVNLSYNIAFASLKNMDVKKEEISINIWQRQYWYDKRLAWNRSKNGNIHQLGVLMSDIWTPDIYLYYSSGIISKFGKDIPGSLPFSATLHSNGLLFFSQPTTIYAPCEVDIGFYPFDDQLCKLTLGTWSQDVSLVHMLLYKGGFDMSPYMTHNEWEIVSVKPEKQLVQLKSSSVGHEVVVYTIHLRRHALFYMINYILPSILIAVLSLLIFLIPPEVGKRMEAGINLLLCLSVYLILVNSKMPLSSKSFPLLTKFYGCTIIILVVSLCCSCWVYSYYFMNPSGWDVYHLPALLQTVIFNVLGPALHWPCKRNFFKSSSKSRRIVVKSNENRALEGDYKEDHRISIGLQLTGNANVTGPEDKDGLSKKDNPFEDKVDAVNEKETELISRGHLESSSTKEERERISPDQKEKTGKLAPKKKKKKKKNTSKVIRRTIAVQRITNGFEEQINECCSHQDNVPNESHCYHEDTNHREIDQHVTGTSVSELTVDAVPSDSQVLNENPHILYLAESSQQNEQKFQNTEKWKSAATILDKFFIILLVVSIVASFLACFLTSPRVRMGSV